MCRFRRKTAGKRRAWQTVRHLGGEIVVPDELTVSRILGDQPFAEIGRPVWAVTDADHGCVIAAGDLGHVMWRGTGHWLGHRIGVYEAGTLRPRHVQTLTMSAQVARSARVLVRSPFRCPSMPPHDIDRHVNDLRRELLDGLVAQEGGAQHLTG